MTINNYWGPRGATPERIDHVAAAELGLSVLEGEESPDRLLVVETMAAAQVHATLALVEQQRIANVLFIARETHADLIAGLEAMGLDEDDFEVPLRLNNIKKAGI